MSDTSDISSVESTLDNKEKVAVDPLTYFSKKEICYYKMIDRFFKKRSQVEIQNMIDIISESSDISLRILDWFVTRYSKKRIDITLGEKEAYDVHISYRAQLKSYKKKYFDPFRRWKKFWYNYDKTDETKLFHTTLGQLNFFKWALSNNIIKYVTDNIVNLTKSMNNSNKEEKTKKNVTPDSSKTKKGSIKVSATKTVNEEDVKIVLTFD